MPKLRTLSGSDLLQIFKNAGFSAISQRGSHVKLRRVVSSGMQQTLTIVLHDDLGPA
jgi:predicted RNA binding protein YcfA (HicA-like mRNA interferase family)